MMACLLTSRWPPVLTVILSIALLPNYVNYSTQENHWLLLLTKLVPAPALGVNDLRGAWLIKVWPCDLDREFSQRPGSITQANTNRFSTVYTCRFMQLRFAYLVIGKMETNVQVCCTYFPWADGEIILRNCSLHIFLHSSKCWCASIYPWCIWRIFVYNCDVHLPQCRFSSISHFNSL